MGCHQGVNAGFTHHLAVEADLPNGRRAIGVTEYSPLRPNRAMIADKTDTSETAVQSLYERGL